MAVRCPICVERVGGGGGGGDGGVGGGWWKFVCVGGVVAVVLAAAGTVLMTAVADGQKRSKGDTFSHTCNITLGYEGSDITQSE